jgi:Ca2+-binding EF-hand superfamily protein
MGESISKADMKKYKAEFQKYDINKDGVLDKKELTTFLVCMGLLTKDKSEFVINTFLEKYDTSKDGKINVKEFSKIMRGKTATKK